MSKVLISEERRKIIELLLPEEPSKPKCGRARVDDRAALPGIVFLLKSGIPWEMLPKEMGCESGSTCWRRLGDWQEAGVWEEPSGALGPLGRGRSNRLGAGFFGLRERAG